MPTATFTRLPQEKQERLMAAAWTEFTQVPFSEVSINRIIHQAQIPRGSFYQYFEDKNDLFLYLIDQIRDELLKLLDEIMGRIKGDLFQMPLYLFDALVAEDGKITPRFARDFVLLRLNVNMDIQQLFFDRAANALCPQRLLTQIAPDCLKRTDEAFVGNVFSLLVGAVGASIAQVLYNPQSYAARRELLVGRVDIIKNGSAAEERDGTADE